DDLEVGDLCSLLVYNSKKDAQWNLRLFDVVEVSESFRNDLRFVATLRNKYFHLKGRRTLTSNEQLADLLLVERVVEGLSSICNAQSDALQSRLRKSLNDLITQVAQVMMPNQVDQDGEKTVLGVEDREFIKDLFTAGISRPVHPVPELSSDRSAFPDNRAH